MCCEPSNKTLCVRARRRLGDEVTEWLYTHPPPPPASSRSPLRVDLTFWP